MTNKPFEVQDSAIVLNGVELKINQSGGIDIDDNPISGGGGIVQRSVNFPYGEEGDTRGTIVLTPLNETLVCVMDYEPPVVSTVEVETNVEFNISQTGGQFVQFTLTSENYPELQGILGVWVGPGQNNYANPQEFSVTSAGIPGGARTCVSAGYLADTGDMFFIVEYAAGDDSVFPIGTVATISYVTSQGPQIWVRIDNGVIDRLTNTDGEQAILDETGTLFMPENGGIWFNYGYIDQDTDVDNNTLRLSGGNNVSLYAGEDTKRWLFDNTGDITLPEGGDIVDSQGNSVLGGAIPNTKKGFINLVGDKPNEYDDIWFESVAVNGNFAYVGGGDYYVNNSEDLTKVYKFNLETGEQVWVKEIVAGRGAQFSFSITSEVITITNIDSGGQGYIVGEELYFPGFFWPGGNTTINRVTVVVDTVDGTGAILTASIKPGYNLTGIGDTAQNAITASNDNARGSVACIAYDTYLDKLIVVSGYQSGIGDNDFDSDWTYVNVYVLDPDTAVIDQTLTLSSEGDINANSIKIKGAPGGIVVVGEKFGEFRQFGTLILSAGYNGYFDILKSDLDPEHYPGGPYDSLYDFWVSGTGIPSINNVDAVNQYENLPTTVRQGSGAQFAINDDGAGGYTLIGVNAGGTNYLPGHKIKILGSTLGGVDVTNDAIITVTAATNGSIDTATISGTAGSIGPWTNIGGTNYQVGSGATMTAYVNTDNTGTVNISYFNAYGTNYVNGDVLTIAGTNFAGGTSPANDVTLTINSVGGSGEAYGWDSGTVTGTAPSNILRLYVNGVDFTSTGGSWSMKQNLGGEAFVWTPTWSNAIGGPSGDRFFDACYSEDGNSIFAVGRGRYETLYDQALVVKFDAETGAVIWGKDIKFSEAATENREARSVCKVPTSPDIIVAGAWYNNSSGEDEIILTRMTEAGVAVWQKTYLFNDGQPQASNLDIDYEMRVQALNSDEILVTLQTQTPQHSRGLTWLIIDHATGAVVNTRVLSADGNSNYNYYNTPTANFSSIYSGNDGVGYVVMAGYTYIPTDYYYNALLINLPLDGYKPLAVGEYVSIGEHILGKYDWSVTTVTPAFDSFTPTEHVNTIVSSVDQKGYTTRTPDALLQVFRTDITDDSAGYLEFGDGSRQSFATDKIPQIPAVNDYYLTEQDSGKHIFFELNSGTVYIPQWSVKNLPVGFAFTVVNTTGSTCFVTTQTGDVGYRPRLKLAGRNIDTYTIGIPDSGSGSMVTFLKVKSGYAMENTDLNDFRNDVWMVSGPSDIYDND